MTVALARRPATPYARRLARERGLALTAISGSGPGGRIVAADVEAFVVHPPTTPPATATAPAATVSAYAMTVDLGSLRTLLADFGKAQVTMTLDAMLLRAAALALEAVPGAPDGSAIGWETGAAAGRREVVLAGAQKGLVSRLDAELAKGLADAGSDAVSAPAALSVRRIRQAGVRPASLPLLAGHAMRLIVVADNAASAAECLLCFNADVVGEDAAAAILARFRDGIEMPVRLLA